MLLATKAVLVAITKLQKYSCIKTTTTEMCFQVICIKYT